MEQDEGANGWDIYKETQPDLAVACERAFLAHMRKNETPST